MMKIYTSTNDTSVIIVLGKTEENCQKAATRYFVNNHIKGAAVPIDLVKSTYSVEEESTIISFDVRKV